MSAPRITKLRGVAQKVQSIAVSEGAGVTIYRSLGTPALKHLDPFLMLDHFGSDNPEDYIAGFPEHPHRGFNTFTYMLDGHMEHRDSMGNCGDLQAGGAQWMKAASGVLHSEMPQQSNGLMRGFQLWINLPAAQKMSDPAYQEYAAAAFPVVRVADHQVKVLAGEYVHEGNTTRGPVEDPNTKVMYLDVILAGGSEWTTALPEKCSAFIYVFEGEAMIGTTALPQYNLGVLASGDGVQIRSGAQPTRFILVSGMPLTEPVVQSGPFVMNTREEIQQAFADFHKGCLVTARKGVQDCAG